jgi:hypothetical protein
MLSYHCSECGEEVTEFCAAHLKARVDSVRSGPRKIREIAWEVSQDWKPVNFGAKPYLIAMFELGSIGDKFGQDDARSILLYFLSNAKTWRGPVAKRIKAELKGML